MHANINTSTCMFVGIKDSPNIVHLPVCIMQLVELSNDFNISDRSGNGPVRLSLGPDSRRI